MPLVAKQLGNTGSTGGNRIVWHFITSGKGQLDSDPGSALDLNSIPLSNVHNAGIRVSPFVTFTKMLQVQVFQNVSNDPDDGFRLAFTRGAASTTFVFSSIFLPGAGDYDFSNIGGLKLYDTNNTEILLSNRSTAAIDADIAAGVNLSAANEYNYVRGFGPTTTFDGQPMGAVVEFRI